MKGLFVTGTDTDIGKTVVSAIFTRAFKDYVPTQYYKPVQSGTEQGTDFETVKGLVGSDFSGVPSTWNFKAPLSPNRAAEQEGQEISSEIESWTPSFEDSAFTVVEGAGGILVPINAQKTILDIIEFMDLPVAVVASTKLGTINHSLLTWKMLAMKGLNPQILVLVGDTDEGLSEVIQEHIEVPHILNVPNFSEICSDTISNFVSGNLELKSICKSVLGSFENSSSLFQKDKDYVWHPFTQHGTSGTLPEIVSGQGALLKTAKGQTLIDGISSWWVNMHGHGHFEVAEAVARQAHKLEHVIFAGFTHEPGARVSETLVRAAQERNCDIKRAFFSDNGSTAVEVALKMAYQYHQNHGDKSRSRFLTLKGAYHGDTVGAMSVGGRGAFFEPFEPLMFPVDAVEPGHFEDLEEAFANYGSSYAAFVLEPMVQGAGGMRFYSAAYLDRVGELAKKHGVLTIADEIFTGFYRTGKLFAFEHSSWRPDLICLSKGLTGGFLPMSLTLSSEKIFEAFKGEETRKAFLHGHSYTANPIACAAALASWQVLQRTQTQKQIQALSRVTTNEIQRLKQRDDVENLRSIGTLGAFDFKAQGNYFSNTFSKRFHQACLKKDLLLRPLGTTVYTLPPYCTTPEQLTHIYNSIHEVLDDLRSSQ